MRGVTIFCEGQSCDYANVILGSSDKTLIGSDYNIISVVIVLFIYFIHLLCDHVIFENLFELIHKD